MAKNFKTAVNNGAGKVHDASNTVAWVAGGIALVAFGVCAVTSVVETLTAGDDDEVVVPVIEDAE